MNHHSRTHQRLSARLSNPRVLTNPEEFLGPNYEAVLNFWLILDDLTKEQLITVERRYWDFKDNQPSEWLKARDEARKASEKTIGRYFTNNAAWAAQDVYNWAALSATREIIGIHKFFEQRKPLTFFQMFLDL